MPPAPPSGGRHSPQVLKLLLNAGLLHGDAMTITGQTLAEQLADVPDQPREDQDVIRPFDKALYREGHLAILKGNLAEDGAVAKITGLKSPVISGPARVFDDESSARTAILGDQIKPGDVVVLRHLGPKGGPGMPEMLALISAIVGRGMGPLRPALHQRRPEQILRPHPPRQPGRGHWIGNAADA